jgi:FtsZ-binding cell division protein ZapB
LEAITRLEELVDRLLTERASLQADKRELSAERDRLLEDRARVGDELDALLAKLDKLEGATR